MFAKLQGPGRSCPACTLICRDPARLKCECCETALPVAGQIQCIDVDVDSAPDDASEIQARSCPVCTFLCVDTLRTKCEICNSNLPDAKGQVPKDLDGLVSKAKKTRKQTPGPSGGVQSKLCIFSRAGAPDAAQAQPGKSDGIPAFAERADAPSVVKSIEPTEFEAEKYLGHDSEPSQLVKSNENCKKALPSDPKEQAESTGMAFNLALQPLGDISVQSPAFTQPVADFDPRSACWKTRMAPVPYRHVAAALDALESTRSRLAKETILTNCFRSVFAMAAPKSEVEAVCYLLNPSKDAQTGGHRLRPDWADNSRPLGIAHGSITSAILESTGASRADFKHRYNELRDSGDVALALRERGGRQRLLKAPPPLTAGHVRSVLLSLADISGAGAEKRKSQCLVGLLRAAVGTEVKWLVRTFIPHMSVGISLEASVLPALGAADVVHRLLSGWPSAATIREAQDTVRSGFALRPDVGVLVEALLDGGIEEVKRTCNLHVGVPMQPMLAKASTSVDEMMKRIMAALPSSVAEDVRVTAEHKYDGQRAQIHRTEDGRVRIFSRKIDDMTYKYPDIIDIINRASRTTRPFVLDAEIVPMKSVSKDPIAGSTAAEDTSGTAAGLGTPPHPKSDTTSQIASFQSLATRKRKHVTVENAASESVAVKLFLFDLLFLGDDALLTRSLVERRAAMREEFVEEGDVLAFATAIDVELSHGNPEHARSLLETALRGAVAASCEGLMVKRLDSPYEPSTKRSDCWLKLKKDYLDNMGDSFDLIPIGGWRGQGRKSRWISPWLVATYDPTDGTLGSVCRVMSGFTDQFYREKTAQYLGAEFNMASKANEAQEAQEGEACAAGNSDVEDCESDASMPERDDDFALDDVIPTSTSRKSILLRKTPAAGVETREQPQFWFEPKEVWEIRAADITVSPKHMAARGHIDPDRGLSLRFPRFLRVRDDKRLADATTPAALAALFRKQTQQQ